MKSQTVRSKRRPVRRGASDFDAEGIQRALLAALENVYRIAPHFTLPQFLVTREIMMAERDGDPHTLVSLVKKLDMPFSTASRVVWSLTEEGGDVGIVKYVPHPSDRRKKLLSIAPGSFEKSFPKSMAKAMVEYYGDSVRRLKRAA